MHESQGHERSVVSVVDSAGVAGWVGTTTSGGSSGKRRVVKRKANKREATEPASSTGPKHALSARGASTPVLTSSISMKKTRSDTSASGGYERTVLVVDDSRTNRLFLSRMVKAVDKSILVLTAADGAEGLDMLQNRAAAMAESGGASATAAVTPAVDLVLLDFSMPRMSGPEMARAVRGDASASVRVVPIVGVTGNALPEDQALFLECGAQEVLCKPVRRKQVEEVLGRSAELRE